MLIPKYHRQLLRSLGFPHWFWFPLSSWAFGDRYKFRDGSIAYLFEDEIVTIRKGTEIVWRKDYELPQNGKR